MMVFSRALFILLIVVLSITHIKPAFADVVINEFLASGGSKDWVETYSTGNDTIDLTGWTLNDSASSMKTLSGILNETYRFGYFEVSTRLNAGGDTIKLINSSGEVIDIYTYSSSIANISEGRYPDGSSTWGTFITLTPNASNIDDLKPSYSSATGDTAGTTGESILISITTSDNFEVNGANITTAGTIYPMTEGPANVYNYTYNIPLNDDSDTIYNITVSDIAGNTNTTPNYVIIVTDNDAPEFIHISGITQSTTGETFTVVVNATDNIAVTAANITIDGTQYAMNNTAGNNFTYTYNVPHSLNSISYIVTIYDAAGNSNTSSIYTVTITDNDSPSYTWLSSPNAGTTGESFLVNIAAADNIAPAQAIIYVNSINYSMSQTGNNFSYTINVPSNSLSPVVYNATIYDAAGNQNTASTITMAITDNDAPVVSELNTLNLWYNTNFILNLTAIDNINVASVSYRWENGTSSAWKSMSSQASSWNATFDISQIADGNYNINVNITDTSGNSNLSVLWTAGIDKTNPSASINSPVNGTKLTGTAVLNATAADATAGIATVIFNISNRTMSLTYNAEDSTGKWLNRSFNTAVLSEGRYNLSAIAEDFAGNIQTSSQIEFLIDYTPPSVSNETKSPSNIYENTDVILNATITDASGISIVLLESDFNRSMANYSASNVGSNIYTFTIKSGNFSNQQAVRWRFYAADIAGNTAYGTLYNFTIQNRAPVFAVLPSLTWPEDTNTTINLALYFSDPDGDNLTYSYTPTPSNITITINQTTAIATLVPNANFTGSQYINFTASDSMNTTIANRTLLNVTNVNDAPSITSTPNANATESAEYTYDLDASDIDSNNSLLVYGITSPANAVINSSTGLLKWTPSSSQIEIISFTVTAKDPENSITTQSFNVTVLPALDIINIAVNGAPANLSRIINVTPGSDLLVEFYLKNRLESKALGGINASGTSPSINLYNSEFVSGLSALSEKKITFSYKLPYQSVQNNFSLNLSAGGEDSFGNVFASYKPINFAINKTERELSIASLRLSRSNLTCNKNTVLTINLTNTGNHDETAAISIYNDARTINQTAAQSILTGADASLAVPINAVNLTSDTALNVKVSYWWGNLETTGSIVLLVGSCFNIDSFKNAVTLYQNTTLPLSVNLTSYTYGDAANVVYTILNETNTSLTDCSISSKMFVCTAPSGTGISTANMSISDTTVHYFLFNINVLPVNHAPKLNETLGDQMLYATRPFYYDVNATDIDGGETLAFADNTSLFNINPATGIINFTPMISNIGNHSINISVTDSQGAVDSKTVIFSILFGNALPQFNGTIPSQAWNEDSSSSNAFDLDSYFSDADGDALSYIVHGNSNITVTINSNNQVSFSQPADWYGNETIFFNASDSINSTKSNDILLIVASVNDAPVINSYSPSASSIFISESGTKQFSLSVTDIDSTPSIVWYLNGNQTATGANYTYTASGSGTAVINATITDGTYFNSIKWTLTSTETPVAAAFDGSTTDFSSLNESELSSAVNITLEKTASGKLQFTTPIDLRNSIDLDNCILLTGSVAGLDQNCLPDLKNEPARITLYHQSYTRQPKIYYNSGFTSDSASINSECTFCNLISYTDYPTIDGTVVFTVDHFTVFTVKSSNITGLTLDDLEVRVDDEKHSKIDEECAANTCSIEDDVYPGSEITIELELKNNLDVDIEDTDIDGTLYDIDDNDNIDDDTEIETIKAGKTKSAELTFKIPLEVEEDDYDLAIDIRGEDENNNEQKFTLEFTVSVDKQKHEIMIKNADLLSETLSCSRTTSLDVEIMNIGEEDENDARITVTNQALGIALEKSSISLDADTDDDNRYSAIFAIDINEKAKAGTYPLQISAYSEHDSEEDTASVDLKIEDCTSKAKPVEVKTPKPITAIDIPPGIFAEPAAKEEFTFRESPAYVALLVVAIVIVLALIISLIAVRFNRK